MTSELKFMAKMLAGIAIVAAMAGCSAFKDLTEATKDKAVAAGSDTWGGGGEVKAADVETPVPFGEFWFGRRKVWYVSGKDAAVLNAAANVVRASNSSISANVGTSGLTVSQDSGQALLTDAPAPSETSTK